MKSRRAQRWGCVGRETWIHLSWSHLFHGNRTFPEERNYSEPQILKAGNHGYPHDTQKVHATVRLRTKLCLVHVKNWNGPFLTDTAAEPQTD